MSKIKDKRLFDKVWQTLGYQYNNIETKSDLELQISDTKNAIEQCNSLFEQITQTKED